MTIQAVLLNVCTDEYWTGSEHAFLAVSVCPDTTRRQFLAAIDSALQSYRVHGTNDIARFLRLEYVQQREGGKAEKVIKAVARAVKRSWWTGPLKPFKDVPTDAPVTAYVGFIDVPARSRKHEQLDQR